MRKMLHIGSLIFSILISCTVGKQTIYSSKLVGEHAKNDNTFDDGKIRGVFTVGKKELDFILKNLTADPMKINWDEASLIIHGESKRVMHKGIKYIDRNSPQAPT